VARETGFDGIIKEKTRLLLEQIEAEVSMKNCDLEPLINGEAKETFEVKDRRVERVESVSIQNKGNPAQDKTTARPSYRRRKLRVYIP